MKWQRLKVFYLLSAVFFFLSVVQLSAEWCYSDEQKAELDRIFEQSETERREQERQLITQGMLYEVAEKSIEIYKQEIKDIKTLSQEAEKSYLKERIGLILKAGGAGLGIGAIIVIIADLIIDFIKAQKSSIMPE